jgi:hypothetical protein
MFYDLEFGQLHITGLAESFDQLFMQLFLLAKQMAAKVVLGDFASRCQHQRVHS